MRAARAARRALCLCLLAAALPRGRADSDSDASGPAAGPLPGHGTFTTALTGLDGRPIGETPLNDPQSSVMTQVFVTDVDPLAVCNGACTRPCGARAQPLRSVARAPARGCKGTPRARACATPGRA